MDHEIPSKLLPIFTNKKRYTVIYGGRGSSKSWTVADFLILMCRGNAYRVLCAREIQNSIKDSVHKLLSDRIAYFGLESFFEITENSIKGKNGSEFLFKGLLRNENSLKSIEGIDYCWIEEAHSVSRKSLNVLIPTIRKPGSQIIFTYNPTNETDPVHVDYTLADRDDTLKIEINYADNPFFPDVLRQEMEYDKRVDYDKYLHIWCGQTAKHSHSQIFYGKWRVDNFESPENAMYYYGADWGFSQDPTTLIRCFIDKKTLYIDYEAYGVGIDIDLTPKLFDSVPGCRKNQIIADSARPETISYMSKQGFRIVGAKKGKGSVEDGIQKIRGFENIIIHERCTHTKDEFRTYCYKTDPLTGIISTVIEDKNNHIIDALRYALENINRRSAVVQTIGW